MIWDLHKHLWFAYSNGLNPSWALTVLTWHASYRWLHHRLESVLPALLGRLQPPLRFQSCKSSLQTPTAARCTISMAANWPTSCSAAWSLSILGKEQEQGRLEIAIHRLPVYCEIQPRPDVHCFFKWDLMSASSMVWLWMHDAWCIACAQYHRTKFAPEEQHNTPTQVLFVFSSPYSPVTQNHPQLFDKTLFQSSLSKHLATTPSALNTLNHWNRFISASSPAKPPLKSMIYQVLCFSIISIIKLFYYTDIINQ